ncbi:uncharacterized protein LOC113272764 [Papaver somniferum]|uniref:uncharacterized protein LOC113272764 n=1 Tax=Papaver somniferum TaxID=3469 RepID=UPI000E700E2D|nr:uncharacterized protein LOC113272764 [Papaver somniferum]
MILKQQWKLIGDCKLIPLCKGFFTIKLDNETDRSYIKAGQWEVNYQILRVRNWVSNFRPANVRSSKAQVWIRFPGLGLEFWKENFLFEIRKEIGTPIKIDVATTKCEIGYYANVLVEVDFAQSIPSKIWINTKYEGFFQEVLIHDCPKFCTTCKIVGHLITECYVERNKKKTHAPSFRVVSYKNKPADVPFDICDPAAREEDSLVNSIDTTTIISSSAEIGSPKTGKFNSLVEQSEEESVIMEVPNFLEVAEQNSVQNSVIKFVNGSNGEVTEEAIPVTSWAKTVEKEMVIDNASGKNNSASTSIAKTPEQPKKVGGRAPNKTALLDFTNCLNNCELIQAPKTGLEFSWSNCKHGKKRILCNLDRVVFNQKWVQIYGDWGYKVGLRMVSDHASLLGGCVSIPKPKIAPKKFQKMWIQHPEFLQVVKDSWMNEVQGDPAFVFIRKMKNLKQTLNDWNWNVFGNVNVKIQEAEAKVKTAMQNSNDDPCDEDALKSLVEDQNELSSREVQHNTLLRKKSRIKWVKEGSANTNFFHINMKIRFQFKEVNIVEKLLVVIPQLITAEDQHMLDSTPTAEEIKETTFSIDSDNSPGPDGYSGIFYKNCWDIIQNDFVAAIQFCWNRKFIPKGLNSSFLVLLPKCQGAKTAAQFRPIGLSNAYDAVSWEFLVKVLLKYGFPSSWCRWILTILNSSRISVMVNGGPYGFFTVGRGLRKGDPLSPLLFILMEDVLSRNISQLVHEEKIIPMVVKKGIHPTHLFFADDVFICLNGAKKESAKSYGTALSIPI